MKRRLITLVITGLLILTIVGNAVAANPNPRVIPNKADLYNNLSIQWWLWANSFGADMPFFNTGGQVDISAGQTGNVWFLAGQVNGPPVVRWGEVPAGTSLFFPLVNLLNDYPCPDPTFQPNPGESMEAFLQRTAEDYLAWFAGDPPSSLFAEIDGKQLTDLSTYKSLTPLFMFTGDASLNTWWDPCITGSPQPGVSNGYWLLLPPLTPGTHNLHFGSPNPNAGQDITYILKVTPGN